MPKAPIDSFWDALWLGIQPCLSFIVESRRMVNLESPNDRGLNLMPKAPIESFWGALWLGIQPFLCLILESHRIAAWRAQTKDN